MGKMRRLYKTNRGPDFDHEHDSFVRRRQIYDTIDRQSYQWLVVFVAGVGFFLDGYTLFASNIALPMIAYVYWPDEVSSIKSTCINIATLAGAVFGQLLFGFLADKNGRKMMYGIELALLIGSTVFVVMASTGVNNSMSIYAWLIWWRFVVGIGVGADYPLSAVITSEFAPTKHRARMLATVFFMQPLGQTASNIISLIVVAISRGHGDADLARTVDVMWRWIIGTGAIPGVVALGFRFAIPETPRFLLEIEEIPVKGEFDASTMFDEPAATPTTMNPEPYMNDGSQIKLLALSQRSPSIDKDVSTTRTDYITIQPATLNSPHRLARADIIQYFWTEGNWRTLAGTSLAWLLVDFGFYGIGLSNPQFLAKTWGSLNLRGPAPQWMTNDAPGFSVYDMFFNTTVHAMIILNTGSCIGGLLLIFFAYQLNRVSLQKYSFLTLAGLFIAMGTMFIVAHKEGPVAVVLYIIGQLLFNFGPNSTTYIIPAEVFPTRYRATCHGISAASGKFGSILAEIFSAYYRFGFAPGDAETTRYGWVLIIFSGAMILGAAVTHFWIPPIQRGNGGSKLWGGKTETLETLALGRLGMRSRYVVRRRSFMPWMGEA